MTAMFLRSLFSGAVLAALITTPASAAVTLDPLKPCYVAAQETQRELIDVAASGFTPLSKVEVYVDETHSTTADVLVDGKVSGKVTAPFVDAGEREFTLRVTEQGMSANSITAVSRVTRFSVEQVPKLAKTDQKVHFKGRGFTQPLPIYMHYIYGGRSLKTIKLGSPKGNCGTFNVRRKQFPFKKRPRVGSWTIQFDQLPYYDPQAPVRVPMTIKVKRAPKRFRAR
jgi:hypothetical protein